MTSDDAFALAAASRNLNQMEDLCPRCEAKLLEPDARFCSQCGLQQLRVSEEAVAEPSMESTSASADSVDVPVPNRTAKADWRFALRCAATVALLSGILQLLGSRFDAAALAYILWTFVSATLTVAMYRRGRPALPMSAGMGASLGMTTSVLTMTTMLVLGACSVFLLRYQFHSAALDQAMQSFFAQMKTAPNATPEIRAELDKPEFRAGIMIFGYAIVAAMFSGFMIVTGALSGALFSSIRRVR